MLVEQVAQRTHRETQKLGGVGLIASSATQCFEYVSLLELVQVRGEVDSFFRKLHRFRDAIRIVVCDLLRQAFRLDRAGALERHGSLDRLFQLTNIPRPRVTLEQSHSVLADGQRSSRRGTELLHEMIRELRYVF